MEPLISMRLVDSRPYYAPGDVLTCEYQVDAVEPEEVAALEVSVLWHTEGKGDEDLGVHFFQRHTPGEDVEELRSLQVISTRLPNSPLSYDGRIVKVLWCVRLRLFMRRGRPVIHELPFRLSHDGQPARKAAAR